MSPSPHHHLHVYVHIHLSVSVQTYSSLVLFPPMTVHGCMPVWCSVSLCVYESFWTHTPELIPLNTHCSCALQGSCFLPSPFLPLLCQLSTLGMYVLSLREDSITWKSKVCLLGIGPKGQRYGSGGKRHSAYRKSVFILFI